CMECPHASGCQCKDDRAQTTCNEWISSVPCITSETERFADSSDDLSWRTRRINPERIGGLLECVELTLQERRPGIMALPMGEAFAENGGIRAQVHEAHAFLGVRRNQRLPIVFFECRAGED